MATQATPHQPTRGETLASTALMTPLQLIDRSRQGLSGTEADRIARLLGVSDKEMAPLLNQSVATFHRQPTRCGYIGTTPAVG